MPHQCTDCGRTFADGSKEMLSGCPDCGGNKFQFLPARAVDSGPETGGLADSPKAPGSPAGRSAGGTAPKKAPEDSARSPRSGSRSESSATGSGAAATDSSPGPETGGDDPSAVDRAAATVRDWVRSGGSDDGDRDESRSADPVASTRTDAPENRNATAEARNTTSETRNAAPEDSAQANARSDVVSEAELPDAPPTDSSADATEPPRDGEVVDTPNEDSPGLKELREELNSQFESIRIVEPGQYELNLMELYEREEYIIALKEDGKYVIEVPDRWESSGR